MRAGAAVVTVLLGGACGDNLQPEPVVFEGTNGARLKLQWYLYRDGAREPDTRAFYDTKLHVACERRAWIDGVTRCTPLADATVFADAACTVEVGRSTSRGKPRYFLGHELMGGEPRLARLFRAGPEIDPPPRAFERHDGACVEIPVPEARAYFELAATLEPGAMVELWTDTQMMDGRLGLEMVIGFDGLAAPIGFRDHELDIRCRPETSRDGTATCVPADAAIASHFADPYCEVPAVVATAPPRVVTVTAGGCATHHAVGSELAGIAFRELDGACVVSPLPAGARAYGIGAPLELSPVERTVEHVPGRRLHGIVIRAGDALVIDTPLFDTASASECTSTGGERALCAPANLAAATRAFADDRCAIETIVADLPRASCTLTAFAIAEADAEAEAGELAIHAIGLPAPALYARDPGDRCVPRTSAPDTVTHLTGPALPPDLFVSGVLYSER